MRQIAQEVGPVTGVIHGAGVNKPRRIEQVDETEALRKIGPKLVGLLNLCDALENAPPKLPFKHGFAVFALDAKLVLTRFSKYRYRS